jgi:hypothetical protein
VRILLVPTAAAKLADITTRSLRRNDGLLEPERPGVHVALYDARRVFAFRLVRELRSRR